jgi:hypothetical protein
MTVQVPRISPADLERRVASVVSAHLKRGSDTYAITRAAEQAVLNAGYCMLDLQHPDSIRRIMALAAEMAEGPGGEGAR